MTVVILSVLFTIFMTIGMPIAHSMGLAAVLTDGLAAVEAACAEALDQGTHSADVILNILTRQRDTAPPVTIMTPEALRLRHVPVADCARYDSLRRID